LSAWIASVRRRLVVDIDQEKDPEVLRQAAKLALADNERLVRRIVALTEELAELRGKSGPDKQLEMERLQEQLAELRGDLYGRSSERRGRGRKKKRSRKPRTGHGPKPQLRLERVQTEHHLEEADRVCPKCGGTLEPWTGQQEETEEVDVIERRFVIRVHRKHKYRCCDCRDHVETALGPEKLIRGGRYSLDFAVSVALAKYGDHLPLERQVRIMRREGLEVSSQTLWDQVWALSQALRPLYDAIGTYVRSSPVICADETYWRMLSKKSKGKWYLWGACRRRGAYYEIQDSRSKEAGAKLLHDFSGTLVCDGYGVYVALAKDRAAALQLRLEQAGGEGARAGPGPLTLACCWSHARRPFVKLEGRHPKDCEHALELIGKLYDVEREVPFEAAEDDELAKQLGLRTRLRDEVSRPIVAELMDWAAKALGRYLPSSKMGEALGYLLNQRSRLETYLDDPLVPIDNNQMERGLRNPVIGRKNFYGTKTERGAEAAAVIYSVIESCRLAEVEPKEYLAYAARHAIAQRGEPTLATPLLPHKYKATKQAE